MSDHENNITYDEDSQERSGGVPDDALWNRVRAIDGIEDGTHNKQAQARDILVSIIDDHPEILTRASDASNFVLLAAAQRCLNVGPLDKAIEFYRIVTQRTDDPQARAALSESLLWNRVRAIDGIEDGTHNKQAQARDILVSIIDDHPEILTRASDASNFVLLAAAQRCLNVGPLDKAIEFYRIVTQRIDDPQAWAALSESLTHHGSNLEEALAALERAMQLAPDRFDNEANRETVRLGRAVPKAKAEGSQKRKVGRYPKTEQLRGNLEHLILEHIALDEKEERISIHENTRFFSMGSCFARNISRSLRQAGYASEHMDISEHINTTFANRCFADWLSAHNVNPQVSERFKELLPTGWTPEKTIESIKNSDVFILTLGVAPAFFDRQTGDFVLPRPSSLSAHVLAERYMYKTTSVSENVENIRYLINFIKKQSENVKIILTVSPVPLLATFEFASCVEADCISKSTMRLAAHEIVQDKSIGSVSYWPSFEVFRWVGSNCSDFYAGDDGAAWHVTEEKVDSTVRAFIRKFSI